MDTVTGQHTTSDERILLELEARSIEESDAITAQAQTGPQLPMRSADARLWAEADADALSQLSNLSRQAALDVIARNMLASGAYDEQINMVAPQLAMAAKPVVHAQQVAHVIATHLPLQPDVLIDRAVNWPAHVMDYFRAPDHRPDVQQHVERMLNGISKDTVHAFQKQVASMLAPAPAGSPERTTTPVLRIHTAWDLTYEEQVRHVARVISENANLVPWKVDANLRREPAAVHALLSDPVQMRVLENDVAALIAVPAERVAQVHAMIEQSSQIASQRMLRQYRAMPRPATADGTPSNDHALQLVANFIASAQNLTKEAIYAKARYAPPATQAILGNTGQMRELDEALGARLAFLPAGRIAEVQAVIAAALGRTDAGQREQAAQAMHAPVQTPTPPERPSPETVQRTIDFLATATTLYDDKIPERLATAASDVKALLSDAGRMKELDDAINMRLAHIRPDRLAAAQATIAVTLNRPDAGQRVQVAQTLWAGQANQEKPQTPTAAPAPEAKSEPQALQERFKQHIASATPIGDKRPGMGDLYDRIAARHRLYDTLAIVTRMDRGEEIMGGARPHALRGVVSSGLARQWAKLDAADLHSMLHTAGDRLENLAQIQAAVDLINGTAERDQIYRSNLHRVAPTMREDVGVARLRSESHAIAEFVRDNHTYPAWKIQSNLDRAVPALQRILRDGKRMGELAAAVQEQLPQLEKHQRLAVQAAIDGDLQRADLMGQGAALPPAAEQSTAQQLEQAHDQVAPPAPPAYQPASPASKGASPGEMTTVQSTRNGIVPAAGAPTDHAPVVKKLLEDMSYKIRADGSVLYQVQGKDAFIDHGDQLLMIKGAEKEERAILGALLLAKEKYAGAFELTGSEAFKRAAIDVLVKYQLDVRLKNPEQDLLRRETGNKQPQKEFARATHEHPAVPIDLAALASRAAVPLNHTDAALTDPARKHPAPLNGRQPGKPIPAETTGSSAQRSDEPVATSTQAPRAATAPAPSNTDSIDVPAIAKRSGGQATGETTPTDHLSGTLLSYGTAPYQNTLRNDASYYVDLKNSDGQVHTHWGQGLATALKVVDARIGDEISLKRLETIDVTKKVPKWDDQGNFLEQRTISGYRNHWEAHVLQRLPGVSAATLAGREPEEAPAASQLTGTLLRHGTAPYQNSLRNDTSYFVELLDHDGQVHTQWGKQLGDVLQTAQARIGDKISLKWLGTKDGAEHSPDSTGRRDREYQLADSAQPIGWHAQILERRPRSRAANHVMFEPGQPASSAAEPAANLLQGRLLAHGAAPLKNAKDGKPSYFVQIQNHSGASRTFWGLDLERALVKSGAQKGDDIVLQNLGRKPVQVEAPTRDQSGNVIGMGTAISHRNAWEISTSRPISRHSEAISAAEASPALQASSVAVREAAWWQRQAPFLRACIEETPALLGRIDGLGPRPDSRAVAWIDQHGDRRVVANDISYGAICDRMPSMKDANQPVLALEGGALDGHSQAVALKLIRASENYLQGIAQVDGKVRHVVALLPNAQRERSLGDDTPIPLMAAIPSPDGFTWERIGQLRADKVAPAAMGDKQTATMNVDIGRESIRVQVHTQPGDALYHRLGFAAASESRQNNIEPSGQHQSALHDRKSPAASRPAKPDTPTYA